MKRFLKVKYLLFAALLLSAMGSAFLTMTLITAPKLDEVDVTPEGYLTTVVDDSDETMVTLAGVAANRIYVDLDQIPEDVQNAFIAIEDERFYSHHGVDLKGLARAILKGITHGKLSEGASTITQQLLKNNVFTNWTEEKSFLDKVTRKLQEQFLAIRLEGKKDKAWILENYLNTINLGGGSWGVQAASKRYFGKNVSDLSLSEAAVIAGITKNPTAYNPLEHADKNKERRALVLSNMLEQGLISQEAYDEAIGDSDSVYKRIEENHTDSNAEILSYFEDALVTNIVEDLMEQHAYTEAEAWEAIYRGGLTIYSTQDSKLQKICEEEVNNSSLYSGEEQVSVVMMDEGSGAVKAIVGGRGTKESSLVYNRATESVRQPGSTIKIIGEYAATLDTNKATLGTCYDDSPYTYSNGKIIGDSYQNYKGQITMRNAIAVSSNVAALKAFQSVGIDSVVDYLEKFGITTLTKDDEVESLAIGGTHNGVTNLELTAAYTAIGAGGVYTKPYYYTKVLDHDGNVLLEHTDSSSQIISEESAYLLTSAMEEVLSSGTGTSAAFSGMPLAGKSGTTQDSKDAWFVGYSPYFSCGIWGGYDSNDAQKSSGYVKTLWKNIMSKAHKNYIEKDFEVPSGIETAEICSKCGKLAVNGLCDDTVQGDMTYTESFVSGTAPTESCDCHESVTICSESGMLAGSYCPSSSQTSKTYLKSASEETEDANYVLPDLSSESCTTHTSLMDKFFGGEEEGLGYTNPDNSYDQQDGYDNPQNGYHQQEGGYESQENTGGWRESIGNWFR